MGGIAPADVDYVALARPLPTGSALPIALRMFPKARVVSIDHHAAHAASAYLVSPFERATVITLDREGDLRCGAKWRGEGNRLTLEDEILYPDSVGELYGRVTEAARLAVRVRMSTGCSGSRPRARRDASDNLRERAGQRPRVSKASAAPILPPACSSIWKTMC